MTASTSEPHPDFCDHDETSADCQLDQHIGCEVYVVADYPGDPTFVVAAVAHPDAEETRAYSDSTVQLSVLDTGSEPGEFYTCLYPGTVRRLIDALEQALAAFQAAAAAHPLDPT